MQKRPFGVRKKHAKRAQQQTCLTAVSFIRTIPSALELHQISIRRFAGRWSRTLRAAKKAAAVGAFCASPCAPLLAGLFTAGGELHPALKQTFCAILYAPRIQIATGIFAKAEGS